jgi:hypothetical protein
MATKRSGQKSKNDSASMANDLIDSLSANLSRKEIQKIFERSLLSLDPAGIERLAAGLERETAATVRRVLKSPCKSPKTKAPQPTIGKIRQEWDSAWQDWNACIAETTDEGGKYVLQEHHWEPPYLDESAFADDLEPIAARMHVLLPHVFDRNLAPDFSFAHALRSTAEEIGGNSECVEDCGEGLTFGPKVTRCLLEWEWRAVRRDNLEAFEFLDSICALEHSGEELYLDHSTIGGFVSALEADVQKEMLQGIVRHRQSGHWARALASAHGGWFALYKKLCQRWDPGRFLEVCQQGISQNWKLALPVMDDLIARKAFPDAVLLVEEAVRFMLRMRKGERWDPRRGLILRERSFPYDGEKDPAVASLLKRWIKVARAVGDEETACSLELQLAALRHWIDGDAILQALQRVPSPSFDRTRERIYEDWRSLIAVRSVESAMDEFAESDHGWIQGLVDAARAGSDGPALFWRVVLSWLDETGKTRTSLHRGFKSLTVLTLDLASGSELKKASPALQRLLSRQREGDRRLAAMRRTWLKRLRAGELLPEVIQFWKRSAARFVPDPEHSAGNYDNCAEWLAVLRDFDPLSCEKILQEWKLAHRRRKNLWKVLERAKLILR